MTTNPLADHPQIAELDAAIAQVDVHRLKALERFSAAAEKNRAALAEWGSRCREAALTGKPEPARPAEADVPRFDVQLFVDERQRLNDERRAVIADVAAEVEAGIAEQQDEILAEAAGHAQKAVARLSDYRALVAAAREVRQASGMGGRDDELRLPAGTVDPLTFLAAVLSGGRLIGKPPGATAVVPEADPLKQPIVQRVRHGEFGEREQPWKAAQKTAYDQRPWARPARSSSRR